MLKISTLECYISSKKIKNYLLNDSDSLGEPDVLITDPAGINKYFKYAFSQTEGRMMLYSTTGSDDVIRLFRRRRSEIEELLKNGKVIVVILRDTEVIYAEKNYLKEYEKLSNYSFLPDEFERIIKELNKCKEPEPKLPDSNHEFAEYFNAYSKNLKPEVCINKSGNIVGFIECCKDKFIGFTMEYENGTVVFIPPPDNLPDDNFVEVLSDCSTKLITKERLLPKPEYMKLVRFRSEDELIKKLEKNQTIIDRLTKENDELLDDLKDMSKLKMILYEKGTALNAALKKAFNIIGFEVEKMESAGGVTYLVLKSDEGIAVLTTERALSDTITIKPLEVNSSCCDEYFHQSENYPTGMVIFSGDIDKEPDKRRIKAADNAAQLMAVRGQVIIPAYSVFRMAADIIDKDYNSAARRELRFSLFGSTGVVYAPEHNDN